MQISPELLLAMALGLLAIGLLMFFFWPVLPLSKPKDTPTSVTLSGTNGIITVRNAAGGDLNVFFGSSGNNEPDHIIPSLAASDTDAESEVTILDELRNPNTHPKRKAEIEAELMALGYRIIRKPNAVNPKVNTQAPTLSDESGGGQDPSPRKTSQGTKEDDDAAGDESLDEVEPRFESFHMPSE